MLTNPSKVASGQSWEVGLGFLAVSQNRSKGGGGGCARLAYCQPQAKEGSVYLRAVQKKKGGGCAARDFLKCHFESLGVRPLTFSPPTFSPPTVFAPYVFAPYVFAPTCSPPTFSPPAFSPLAFSPLRVRPMRFRALRLRPLYFVQTIQYNTTQYITI